MSEHMLEIWREADGRFLALPEPRYPPVEVTSWDEVRRLRGRHHLVDHWQGEALAAFIAAHGHPFDDWWQSLSPACASALLADPFGPVPAEHHTEVKRTLLHQPKQKGLELEGSLLSPELRAYVAARAGAPDAASR
jgi:hypothetical protein